MAARIKILLTVPHFTSTASPYREMMSLATYLPRDQFELTICGLRANGLDDTAPQLDALGVRHFVATFRPKGITFRHIRKAVAGQRLIQASGRYDIQHSTDFTSSPFEALFARLAGRQFIQHQRNANFGGHDWALRMKFRLAQQFVAVSDGVAQKLIREGLPGSKVRRIYNGIVIDTRRPDGLPPAGQPRTILCVGHLERRKRHADAIHAMARLSQADVCLHIAGNTHDEAYVEELKALVEQRDLADRVSFLGVRNDVADLLYRASALLLCSESEGLPWAVLEAMAAGVPVIASDIPGTRELIEPGKTGFLVPVGDLNQYAGALEGVLTDAELVRRVTTQARELIQQKFSEERMVNEFVDVYYEAMQAARGQSSAARAPSI